MNLAKDVIALFFPDRCLHCKKIISRNQQYICNTCFLTLENTGFIDYINNPLEQLFIGRVQVEQAASLYFYQKETAIQTLLKALKYQNLEVFGKSTATHVIQELTHTHRFNNIDVIIPVPLHSKKEIKRGYNQVELFGKTIANYLKIPFVKNALIRKKNNDTQTQQTKEERFKNVQDNFVWNNEIDFHYKNILIVDDVLTTGATLMACAKEIKKNHSCKIYIITIACVV